MINFQQVSKSYGKVSVLEKINFQVEQGDRVVLRGPSGSGKTTLLRLIAGLELPTQGQIFLSGILASAPAGGIPPHQRGIGFVFQQAALWPHLTVTGNLHYPLLGRADGEIKARIQELLFQTGLDKLADRYPGELSGGEQRTVALARALAARPGLLLLDEPLTSLDREWKNRLLALIRQVAQEPGVTTLYVTHDEEEAEGFGNRALVLCQGRLEMS